MISRHFLSLFVLFVSPALAWGQTITLNQEYKVARPGVVNVKPASIDADNVVWVSKSDGLQFIPSFLLKDSKIACGIAMAEGTYTIQAHAVKSVNGKAEVSEVAECTVIVGKPPPGPAPGPGPGPNPPPNPQPPPTDELGFVALASREAAKIPASARGLAKPLADNFESVMSTLAATSTMTVDEANLMLRDKNRATLGSNIETWRPWFEAWAALQKKHNEAGLSSRDHYIESYKETAAGLRSVPLSSKPGAKP